MKTVEEVVPVRVWPWSGAPAEYRSLSEHGGDEDWVAFIPAESAHLWFGWMEEGTAFGCCSVSEHVFANGSIVRIGAHA